VSAFDPKLQDEAARLRALQRYSVLDTGPEQSFDLITGLVRDLLHVPICAVSLIDEQRQSFKSRQGLALTETPRSMAFCDHAIRSYQSLVIEDATRDTRFADNPLVTGDPNIRAYAGVPLTTPEGFNVGSLCAIDRESRRFSPDDLALLERFADLIVEQLELRTLAMTDPLTGALSRRGFIEAARRAFCSHVTDKAAAALISFDLDHFKDVNERLGHDCGNDVLHGIGNAALRLLRPDDRLGRLGGEEFGVLLSGTNLRQAKACAERLRRAFETLSHPRCGPITASFGIAMLERGISLDDWQVRVARALQTAKEQGRNCTMLYDPVRHGPTPDRRRNQRDLIENCARWRSE